MADTPRRYAGQEIEVSFDAGRCIHAAECVRGLPAVFDTARRPWILPDGAAADAVAAVIGRCPSGALRYRRLDGGPQEQPQPAATVDAVAGGPLYVRGDVRLLAANDGLIAEGPRMALCRCGQSRNKPFCDNSHRAAGFADPGALAPGGPAGRGGGAAGAQAEGEPAQAAGPLTIVAAADGPLLLRGPFTLRGTGGGTLRGDGAALCRCGGSGRKPFCDGTHKRIGFTDQEATSGE